MSPSAEVEQYAKQEIKLNLYISPKRRACSQLHGVATQNNAFIKATSVITSDPTLLKWILNK
jgi:hypothetical protein